MKKLKQRQKRGNNVKYGAILLLFAVSVMLSCSDDDEMKAWETEVVQLETAIQPFKDFNTAQNVGYDIKATEYRTQMGFHYLNAGLLDAKFEVEKPEVLIYIENSSGSRELVAVEYGILIEDLNNPPPAPEGYTGSDDVWKVDTEFSLWTLHVWVPMENPEGIFISRNPLLP